MNYRDGLDHSTSWTLLWIWGLRRTYHLRNPSFVKLWYKWACPISQIIVLIVSWLIFICVKRLRNASCCHCISIINLASLPMSDRNRSCDQSWVIGLTIKVFFMSPFVRSWLLILNYHLSSLVVQQWRVISVLINRIIVSLTHHRSLLHWAKNFALLYCWILFVLKLVRYFL